MKLLAHATGLRARRGVRRGPGAHAPGRLRLQSERDVDAVRIGVDDDRVADRLRGGRVVGGPAAQELDLAGGPDGAERTGVLRLPSPVLEAAVDRVAARDRFLRGN